tara:strand:- start:223374 stop:223583 length:210 start_codon:yes stop_codon:yes gene_type:complete
VEELFDTSETAQRLRVTRAALAKWRVAGDGPTFLRCGRKILYRASDIETWLASREYASTSAYPEASLSR